MPSNTIESIMVNQAERNLLKYAAGRAIFCPRCEAIMDWKKTVIPSLYATQNGKEILIKTYTLCANCWDRFKDSFLKAVDDVSREHPEWAIRTEIVDGREPRFKGKH